MTLLASLDAAAVVTSAVVVAGSAAVVAGSVAVVVGSVVVGVVVGSVVGNSVVSSGKAEKVEQRFDNFWCCVTVTDVSLFRVCVGGVWVGWGWEGEGTEVTAVVPQVPTH